MLFRIFHYPGNFAPSAGENAGQQWGVGEHTDYGLLTLLAQDDVGGLQVMTVIKGLNPIKGNLIKVKSNQGQSN